MLLTWIYTLLSVLIVSLISLVGVFTLSIREDQLKRILLVLVSFAAGALLGDAFIHLLPEAVKTSGFNLPLSLSLLCGILSFFILEKLIFWRHCHIPTSPKHPHPFVWMNLWGDSLHNFMDGTLIAGSFLVSTPLGLTTSLAVIMHEIPQEIGDFGVLVHGGFNRARALTLNFVTALTAVLGAVLTLLIGLKLEAVSGFLIPFTAGGFIYIAASDLIPEMHKESHPIKSLIQLISLGLGILIMLSLRFVEF
jgi:zinc and cadmium transporter